MPVPLQRYLMPLLLFAAVLAIHGVLRVRLPPGAALAGAYAFGLYAPAFQPLRSLHKEPLAVLLVALAMLGLARLLAGGRRRDALLGGGALGALVMVRLEYGWLLIGLLGACGLWWLLARDRASARRCAAVLGVGIALCVPWLAYTTSVTGRLLYWGNSGGISLFWMSPASGPGLTGEFRGLWREVAREPGVAFQRPLFERLERLAPLDRDLARQRIAVAAIRDEPGRYARNLAVNAFRLFFAAPTWPRPPTGALVLYAIFNGLLLALVAAGGAVLVRERRTLPAEAAPFAVFAVTGLALHLPTSADPRMAIPLVPPLLWLVTVAAHRQWAAATAPERRRRELSPAGARG